MIDRRPYHHDSPKDRYPRSFSPTDNKFVFLSFSREHRERERGGAVLIYTLLFPALVYNYAIFSRTSPYFFVPGDAPRSKSARHEGVVKSARGVAEPKVSSSASPGWWPFHRTLTPYAPAIARYPLSLSLSLPFLFPTLPPLFAPFVDKLWVDGWTEMTKGNRIRSFFLSATNILNL